MPFCASHGRWGEREISQLKQQIEKPFKISKLDALSRHQLFGFADLELLFGDIAISGWLFRIVDVNLIIFGGHGKWEEREISELRQQIEKPFKISKLDALSRHQLFGIKHFLRSVAHRASEKLQGQKSG